MTRILIIGGGIGGLTAALALRQRGFDVAVYEAAPELRPVGKGIWVPTNAMIVLQRLGLDTAVGKAGWALDRIQLCTTTDGVLQDFDLGKIIARLGYPTISIHRAALVNVLAGALPGGTLQLNKRCTGITPDEHGVAVRFADGTEERGDVLVGADGIHSTVREHILPGVPLRYSGQTCYRGIADWEPPTDLARTCREIWGGAIRIGFSAVGPRQLYWFAPRLAPPNSPAPPEPVADWLAAEYAGFPSPVPEMLRHTPSVDIIRTDLYELAPLQRWSHGRVVLLGDAAHAMTPNLGLGGAQAIEDAYVLAEQLARCPTVGESLAAYERLRLPRARWISTTARRIGRLAHVRRRPVQKVRNWLMKCVPDWLNQRQLNRLYSVSA